MICLNILNILVWEVSQPLGEKGVASSGIRATDFNSVGRKKEEIFS
jgi:hypothetical protein